MSSTGSFTTIPRLNLGLAEGPSRPELLRRLRYALTEVGFLYVDNHGVPESAIDAVTDALPRLFDLPPSDKDEIALANSPHFLGYSSALSEMTAGKQDCREQVEFATELTNEWTPDQPLCERLRGPNQVRLVRP